MMEDGADDIFDYPMADGFVSETRRVPYRTGFRSRQCKGRLSIAAANKLSDRDFKRYIQKGCRFPDPEQDLRDQLAEQREASCEQSRQTKQLQDAVHRTQLQIDQLRSLLSKALQTSVSDLSTEGAGAHSVRGLDVAKR